LKNKTLTNFIKVEGKLSGNGAVQTSFKECGPILRQDVLATIVLLANSSHTRVHVLAAVDVFDGRFSEEEVDVIANIIRSDKVGFYGNMT